MIPPRFILPVLLAAAIHAALFAVFPAARPVRPQSDERVVTTSPAPRRQPARVPTKRFTRSTSSCGLNGLVR